MKAISLFVIFVVLNLTVLCAASEPTASTTSTAVATQGELDDILQNSRVSGLKGYLADLRKWARDPKVPYIHFAGTLDYFLSLMGSTVITMKELGTSQEELKRLLEIRRRFALPKERKLASQQDRVVDFQLRGRWK